MKRVLVTGGSGFVGASLVRRLLRDGHEVHLLVRSGYDPSRIQELLPDLSIHKGDLSDPTSLQETVRRIRGEWIFHLAAHGAYSWQTDTREIFRTNLFGTINLLEACLAAGFESFVNTGSSSEYGFKDHAPSETELLEPNSDYAVAKASATLYCRFAAQRRNVRIVTLRLYSIYGPYEHPDRLIPTLLREGLQGRLPPLVNPDTARDYVYIDDAVEAYLLAARADFEPGALFNVGTGIQTPISEVVEIARRVLDIHAAPEWSSMAARSWDTSSWLCDNRKIVRELGWKPRFTLEQGFRETAKRFPEPRPRSA